MNVSSWRIRDSETMRVARALSGRVAEGLPKLGHATREPGLGHELVQPHAVEDLVLGDRPTRPVRQAGQHVHHVRPELEHLGAPADAGQARLNDPVSEREFRGGKASRRRVFRQLASGVHDYPGRILDSNRCPPPADRPALPAGEDRPLRDPKEAANVNGNANERPR
jgi:hypothetical protein